VRVDLLLPPVFGAAHAGRWFADWNEVAGEPELTLRLPAGAFVRPTGIVLLAAGIAERQRSGLRTRIVRDPGAEDAWQYLQRIDFFAALGVSIDEDFERHDPRGRFVTLRRITDERLARALAEESADCLEARVQGVASSLLRTARFVFEELGVNVVQHSGAPDTGFGVLQSYSNRIEIAFADRGIGFLASLQRNPELAGRIEDEAEALQLAVGKGLTGTSAPRKNMGWGLALLQQFADLLGGELWIASGGALLRRRTLAGARTTTVHACPPWRGSWVCLEAPLAPG
jgi:anti-sigma regulatory factor (Ser/Thr protein kinase)